MIERVRFPSLAANVIEGTVGRWHKREGDSVCARDPIVEIITSKATFDIESPADGILRKILAPEKSIVPVGFILALVGDDTDGLPDVDAENQRLLAEFRTQAVQAGHTPESSPAPRARATPGARRLTKEMGIELSRVPPAEGKSVITENDVRQFGGG